MFRGSLLVLNRLVWLWGRGLWILCYCHPCFQGLPEGDEDVGKLVAEVVDEVDDHMDAVGYCPDDAEAKRYDEEERQLDEHGEEGDDAHGTGSPCHG